MSDQIEWTELQVETKLFERSDHFSLLWMKMSYPGLTAVEAERISEQLRRQMEEEQYAPIGGPGQIKVEWRLEASVVAGRWPEDEAVQQLLPFEEFVDMMERSSPHSIAPPVLSLHPDIEVLADMVKAIDGSSITGPGWSQGENTGQPSTSETDSTSAEQ